MSILVTGGAGYIGSHTVVKLLQNNQDVIVLDNLSNSSAEVFNRIKTITGKSPTFVQGDIRDADALDKLFNAHAIDTVIHFAGLKAVGESVEKPILYYQNNVEGSLTLFDAMQKHGCKRIVFSSSATVYGIPQSVPIDESFPLSATNPYGQSKLMIEEILRDISVADPEWQIALMRYFNPAGAHPSGLIGEDPQGIPNNLMPFIAKVAVGQLNELSIFGNDYSTPDGTGVRDYIHVEDLAEGHIKAIENLSPAHGCAAYNLGTGQGYSVLEMVKAFEQASEKPVPYKIVARRAGDIAACYADTTFSAQTLGWKTQYGLAEMVKDHWNWQKNNPSGYS